MNAMTHTNPAEPGISLRALLVAVGVTAIVTGTAAWLLLRPATVEAPYIIRAAVALYMVAASIPGKSVVKNADTIRRAHPHFVENLRSLGAKVEWK